LTENSRIKVDYIAGMMQESEIVILNMTETWLNKHIENYVKIEGHEIIRTESKKKIKWRYRNVYIK